jgi:hypothetical protein
MPLPTVPTDTEIDAAYPVLGTPSECECFAAIQRAECLSRVIELLEQLPLTALERAMVHRASERSALSAAAEKGGVRH